MKKIVLCVMLQTAVLAVIAQTQAPDTNYANRFTSVQWMPDGKALLFSVVRFHKTNRQAPFFSKTFRYDLGTNQVKEMLENGSNLAPSPDGKSIAFMKRDDNKRADIYLYNIETKEQTLLKTDTTRKNSLSWSPDGKNLLYNITYNGTGQYATIDICVFNLATKQVKQVTNSGKDKSYTPVWSPDSKKIVYYLEKGDSHDQIWLTDLNGSFHTNLTNDTTAHYYFPSWIDEKTIIFTQSPETIVTMNINGTNRKKVKGIKSYQVKYSRVNGLLAYLAMETQDKVMIYDWKKETVTVLFDEEALKGFL